MWNVLQITMALKKWKLLCLNRKNVGLGLEVYRLLEWGIDR